MRFWTSIAEYKTDTGAIPAGSGSSPLSDRLEAGVRRATLSAVIRGCLFRFAPTAIGLLATRLLRWLRLSRRRRADDCRLPPLRFECLAKIVRLRILTRSEEHTSELQSRGHLVCRLPLEKKK